MSLQMWGKILGISTVIVSGLFVEYMNAETCRRSSDAHLKLNYDDYRCQAQEIYQQECGEQPLGSCQSLPGTQLHEHRIDAYEQAIKALEQHLNETKQDLGAPETQRFIWLLGFEEEYAEKRKNARNQYQRCVDVLSQSEDAADRAGKVTANGSELRVKDACQYGLKRLLPPFKTSQGPAPTTPETDSSSQSVVHTTIEVSMDTKPNDSQKLDPKSPQEKKPAAADAPKSSNGTDTNPVVAVPVVISPSGNSTSSVADTTQERELTEKQKKEANKFAMQQAEDAKRQAEQAARDNKQQQKLAGEQEKAAQKEAKRQAEQKAKENKQQQKDAKKQEEQEKNTSKEKKQRPEKKKDTI